MDPFSNRQKAILKYLLNSQDYVPAKDIADLIDRSNKTVYRELNYIEKILKKDGISIDSQPGKGIKLHLTDEQRMKINFKTQFRGTEFISEESIERRRKNILIDLLVDSPNETSIQTLSDKYYVSKASIVNDLKEIEEKIKICNLELLKDQKGTRIIGKEQNIRKCIVDTMNEILEPLENKIQEKCFGRIDEKTFNELAFQFGEFNVQKVEEIVNAEEKEMGIMIGDPYYINIISHILILLKRIKNGYTVKSCDLFLENYTPDLKYLKAAKRIGKALDKGFEIKIPKAEIYLIYQYLTSSGIGVSHDSPIATELIENTGEKTNQIVEDFIKTAGKFFSSDFSDNLELYNGLLLHMKPMINRLKYNVTISNPLLGDIKREFPSVYLVTSLVSNIITIKYGLGNISEDEIAYLTLFLQAAVVKSIKHKNVLVVCSTGIGTSHILESNIKYSFPEWNICDVIPASFLKNNYDLDNIDLIISTVNISSYNLDKPVAYVTVLFNNEDVKNVSEMLVESSLKKLKKGSLDYLRSTILCQDIHFVPNSAKKDIIKKFLEGSKTKDVRLNKQKIKKNIYLYTSYSENYQETNIKLLISNDKEGHKEMSFLIKVSSIYQLEKVFYAIMKVINDQEITKKIFECSGIKEFKNIFEIEGV